MKKKWIIAVCAVVALGALVSTAGAHRGERMRNGRGMQAMMQELDLNAEQREQLKELRQTLREQMRDARDNGQEAMETVREVRRQALGKILNAQQMAQMEQMGVTRPNFGQDFRGGKMGGYQGQWARWPRHGAKNAFAKLDLTEAQKDELKDLRQAHREEADKLRQAHQESLEKVLTKDQHKQLEQLKDEAFYGGKRPHRRRMW